MRDLAKELLKTRTQKQAIAFLTNTKKVGLTEEYATWLVTNTVTDSFDPNDHPKNYVKLEHINPELLTSWKQGILADLYDFVVKDIGGGIENITLNKVFLAQQGSSIQYTLSSAKDTYYETRYVYLTKTNQIKKNSTRTMSTYSFSG